MRLLLTFVLLAVFNWPIVAQTCGGAPSIAVSYPQASPIPTLGGSLIILVDAESQCAGRTLWANARIYHGYNGPCYLDPDFCIQNDTLSPGGDVYPDGQLGVRHFGLFWDTTRWPNGDYLLSIEAHDQYDANSHVNIWVHTVNPAPLPDMQSPQGWIQYPYDGFQIPNGRYASQPIQVVVADDVGVARVDLLDNGVQIATSTTAPYSFTYNPKVHGVHVLQLRVTDTAGNTGRSNTATVTK